MPGDPLAIPRPLAEKVRAPGNDVLAEQILNPRHHPGMRQEIVNAPITEMRGADRVAIAARRERPCQEFIKVSANVCDLVFTENANPGEIAVAVESGNLFRGESGGVLGRRRM